MSKEAGNTGNMTSEPQTEAQEFMYDAFISYRHAPLDMYVAERLHKALESFRVPKLADKETKKLGKSGIKRIFRDRDELPQSVRSDHGSTFFIRISDCYLFSANLRVLVVSA